MRGSEIEKIFSESPLWGIYVATVLFFVVLYFGFAWIGELLSKDILPKYHIGSAIGDSFSDGKQRKKEIYYSLISIIVFGFFGVLPRVAWDLGLVEIKWVINWKQLPFEFMAVFFWNEIHFYCCHWLLHRPWLFKKVHFLHHRSHSPTSYSTYSFHWFEAFLLSTVMIIPMFFYDFCYLTLLFLPVMSLFINTLGHWNYSLFLNKKGKIFRFSERHSLHHSRVKGNYGFFIHLPDQFFGTELFGRNEKNQ